MSPEEYLERERTATEKHEYIDSEMVAMEGKPCLTFSSDARLSVFWDRLITYPDVTVVCGKPEYTDARKDTLANPTVLVEVLSPSTRNYDEGEKASLYR